MKKIMLFLITAFIMLSCDKNNSQDDDQIIPITNIRDYGLYWKCVDMNASLFGAGKENDKEINLKLNDYKPDLLLGFTQAGHCSFTVNRTVDNYKYSINSGKHIVFELDSISKLRATGYIKRDKLYLNFSYIDFDILIPILKDDYPYNKGLTSNITGGEVTLVFTPLGRN